MNYMKKILFVLLIALLSTPAMGQISLGMKGGLAYSSLAQRIDNVNEAGARLGFSVGGLANIPFYNRFSVQPELIFINQGGSFYSRVDDSFSSIRSNYNYYSLQIPVNMAYTILVSDVNMKILFGPSVDYSLTGKRTIKGVQNDIGFGEREIGDFKSWDLGINIGFEAGYQKVFFSINTLFGVLDRRTVKHTGESSIYQNNVTFSLGYYFR